MDTSQALSPSANPAENPLVPTTDLISRECPRFRILIVGRSGVGKSALINAIFKVPLADVAHNRAGRADINREMTSEHNKLLALHDSEGYEPGEEKKFGVLERFVRKRSQKKRVADRIHAIWLCITVPFVDGRIFEDGDEKLFQLDRNKVPIIVVFTKYDLLVAAATTRLGKVGTDESTLPVMCQEMAEKIFQDKCIRPFEELTKGISEKIPYLQVSTKEPDTLKQLVEVTMRNVHVETSAPPPTRILSWFRGRSPNTDAGDAQSTEDLSDSAQVTLAAAQRVDMPTKIQASISVGKKKYWRGIASGINFLNLNLRNCLHALHKDIIKIWNIRGMDEYLLSQEFFRDMTYVVEDLGDNYQDDTIVAVGGAMGAATSMAGVMHAVIGGTIAAGPAAGLIAPVATMIILAAWAYQIYKKTPGNIRCLMGYVVDLTLIMQVVFQASLEDQQLEGHVTKERIEEITNKFRRSAARKDIHNTIRTFVAAEYPFGRNTVADEMELLIRKHKDLTL
ncbi:hypothetical protein AX15_003278 [Amanita polypyramis BW_CC]|nr:hypothetical protein AX15_003278 [Amanita polypyramis BW_CC]